jgi:hypothetical protein
VKANHTTCLLKVMTGTHSVGASGAVQAHSSTHAEYNWRVRVSPRPVSTAHPSQLQHIHRLVDLIRARRLGAVLWPGQALATRRLKPLVAVQVQTACTMQRQSSCPVLQTCNSPGQAVSTQTFKRCGSASKGKSSCSTGHTPLLQMGLGFFRRRHLL